MAFNIPINSIAPYPTPADWVRPADWISITDVENEVQFLVADTGLKAFAIQTTFIKNSGTNIYIDWGDGTIDTISTSTFGTTDHVYSTGGTPCSRGYNTFKIRIWGDATCVITNVKHFPNSPITGGNPAYSVGVLEAYFGDGTMNEISQSLFSQNGTIGASFTELEYVKLPATVTWTGSMQSMFQNCINLHVVVMPTSAASLSNLDLAFYGCTNLLNITFPSNAIVITSLSQTFQNCRSLRTVSFPTTLDSCITFNLAFQNCISLKNVTLPSINQCTNLSGIFQTCQSLQWARFTSFPVFLSGQTAITAPNMFSQCISLQNVYFPSECSDTAFYNISGAFNTCSNLKNIVFPINFNANTLSNTFGNCNNLVSVIFQSPMPSLTDMTSTFNGNYLLSSLTLPVTAGVSVGMAFTFQNCYALKSITIPSGWTLGSLSNTFNGCFNLKTAVLPNNAQNSLTIMLNTFQNCQKLESVTLPTSLTSVTTLQSTFSNCVRLSSVVFPASMPSLATISSTFLNCFNLTSITLPTSATSLTNASVAFQNCYNIETITLPEAVGAITTFSQTFLGCANLKTITLPTTQMVAINNISNMLTYCAALTTINNLDKIGSLVATPLVNGTLFESQTYTLTSLSFNCPFSILTVNGANNSLFNKLNSLRLLNTSIGQWSGVSPQINVSYCNLGVAALDQLFTDLTTVTSKTINITGCTGAASCTRSIATAKGWTITG